jgi:putative salt-induced outer membrane protein YdiY
MIRCFLVALAAGCLSQGGGLARGQELYPADTFWRIDRGIQRLPPVDALPWPDQAGLEPLEQPLWPPLEEPVAVASAAAAESAPAAAEPDAAAEEEKPAEPIKPKKPVKLWKGGVEMGFDGSEGNNETLNFRFGVDAKRKTDLDVLDLDLDYRKKTANSRETANRLYFDARREWLLTDSPWTWFIHHTTEYDEFKAYDVRVSLDTGIGYQFIDNERTSLLGRCGSGIAREIGGPDESFVPELALGLDFNQQLTERQKLSASSEYTPDMTGFKDFRLNTKASWEVLLDETWNLSLKFTVLDRYDSTPNGARANDLDYSIMLLWNF